MSERSVGLTVESSSLNIGYPSPLTSIRIPTLLQHAVLAGRAIVTSASSEADRARHLGYVGMCIGVGMTSGPFIGGELHHNRSLDENNHGQFRSRDMISPPPHTHTHTSSGLLSDVSLQSSAWIATAGSMLSFVTILLFIPNLGGQI